MRKIADIEGVNASTIFRKCSESIKNLPHNNDLTKKYCNRFCGIMVVDGKFIKVKGYERKIPLLWGLDYLSHDIPVYRFAPSENYQAWLKYFGYLKSIKYPMKMVVCDDNENIKKAAEYIFPNVLIQMCHNHFIENIRRDLRVRTDPTYQQFVQELKDQLFKRKIMITTFRKRSYKLFEKYAKDDIAVKVLLKINEHTKELTAANYLR